MDRGRALISVFWCLLVVNGVLAWNFAALNVSNDDVTILHVSVFYLRAFISVKSDVEEWKSGSKENCKVLSKSSYKKRFFFSVPTLVEAIWPETVLSAAVQPFATRRFHHLTKRRSSTCRKLVQSHRTAVDPRGNIFILDNGSEDSQCPPKLIVLSFFNQEIQKLHLNSYKSNSFTDLILDTKSNSVIRMNATRAYLSVLDKDYILAYYLVHNNVRKLKIQPSHIDVFSKPPPISITAMSLLVTRRRSEVAILYDNVEKAVYYVDLRIGRSQGQLYATQLGHLLGYTRSITVDPDGFLYYTADRDGALFRWNTKTKLSAENHEVLHFQTATSAQNLIGAQGALFIINEKPIDEFDLIHSQKILDHYSLQSNELGCLFCD